MEFQTLSRLRIQVRKILWITAFWTVISICFFLSDYTVYARYGSFPPNFEFTNYLFTSFITGVFAGVLGGATIVFIMEKWIRTKSYGIALLYIVSSYALLCTFISLAASFTLFSIQHKASLDSPVVIEEVIAFFKSGLFIRGLITWLVIVLGTMIVLMVNDKYGPGVFLDFLKGKYFRPRKEERIFMFLDIRSSTSIAEKLGEERYFNFLKKIFADITPSILYSKGEIYQYVGDEIVISWKMSDGKQNVRCIKCFRLIQETLQRVRPQYMKDFGLSPEFKAGLHYGKVVAGEIGVVKKDITFSGDVLNTASRIQAKCNEFKVDILLSKYLLDQLSLAPDIYQPVKIGELLLRGKENMVTLYTL